MQWQSGAGQRKSLDPQDWMSLITQLLLSLVTRGRYVPVWAIAYSPVRPTLAFADQLHNYTVFNNKGEMNG